MPFVSIFSSSWRRTLRLARARVECACSGRTWYDERGLSELASRSDVKNSLTEKWENWTTWDPATSTMEIRLEHAPKITSLASTGCKSVGSPATSNRTAKVSASSSTQRGRMETERHR